MEALKQDTNTRFTYADYAKWETDKRWELINGVPYMMASPVYNHQKILGVVFNQLYNQLKGKKCTPIISPFDVCLLGKGNDDETVVQPDVMVVCDRSKIEKNYCNGAPDFIIEVISPSTASVDRLFKMNKYMKAGVKEYWIIDVEEKMLQVYILNGAEQEFKAKVYDELNTVPISVLDGCYIDFKEAFDGIE